MKAGKLPADLLQRAVLGRVRSRRSETVVGAQLGEDAAVLDLGGDLVVAASDPVTGAQEGAAGIAVHVAANDIGAMGAEPVGLLVSALFPPDTDEESIARTMGEVEAAAEQLGVEVIGGHTEVTSTVTAPILVVTAIGRVPRERLVRSSTCSPGDALILTKSAGLEGTAILATDHAARLAGLPPELIASARAMAHSLSAVKDGLIAAAAGASALHDVTEGGVLGASVELAAASGHGVRVVRKQVPVAEATAAICRRLGLDPLKLISSGAMLIASPTPERVLAALGKAGIPAAVIGSVISGPSCVVEESGEVTELSGPIEDELWRFLASLEDGPSSAEGTA